MVDLLDHAHLLCDNLLKLIYLFRLLSLEQQAARVLSHHEAIWLFCRGVLHGLASTGRIESEASYCRINGFSRFYMH